MGTIHQEGMANINMYALNPGAPNFIEQMLIVKTTDMVMGDFNTPLSHLNRYSKLKTNKEIPELN